jgi:hypothetical protein
MLSDPITPPVPTYQGYINSTFDALLLFEACLAGHLNHVPRRPHDHERWELIKSGNVFIFEERASGMKRWTDGIDWSPSRARGNFLIYREIDEPFPQGKRRAINKSRCPSGGVNGPICTVAKLPRVGMPVPSKDKEALSKVLVGSLVDSYNFKAGGLIKKTISVNVNGATHHLVGYYSVDDVLKNQLRRPAEDSFFQAFMPRDKLLLEQNFRSRFEEFNTGDIADRLPYHHNLITARYQQPESDVRVVQANDSACFTAYDPHLAVAEAPLPYTHKTAEYRAALPANLMNDGCSQQTQWPHHLQLQEHHQQHAVSPLEQMANQHLMQGIRWAYLHTPQSPFSDLSNPGAQMTLANGFSMNIARQGWFTGELIDQDL